jgi:Tfp pilus assembly protein PilF
MEEAGHGGGHYEGVRTPGNTVAEQFSYLDEQLARDPRDARWLAAKVHLGLEHDPARALEVCRRVLEESPRNYFALHHAAMASLALGQLEQAMIFAGGALRERDTPEARLVAGHVFLARGDDTHAMRQYETAAALRPGDGAVMEALVRVRARLEQGGGQWSRKSGAPDAPAGE